MKKYRILLISFIILICLSACKNETENLQQEEILQEEVQEEAKSPISQESEQLPDEETLPEQSVEAEDEEPTQPAQVLDLSAYDLQYGQHEEFLKIYEQIQPVEQAENFEETWHRTDTASSLGADITITEQTAEGFSFVGDFYYYSHSGWMEGNALFVAPNVAVYEHINDWGEEIASEYLVFEKTAEGMKVYASAASADLGFGMNVSADGNYVNGEPSYTNATVFDDNFSEEVQAQMQTLLGETNYEECFKFPTEMGILTSTPATLEDGSSATYYDVFVPTMGGYEYQLLVCENGDLYFYSDANGIGFQTTVAGAIDFPAYELTEDN